MNKYKNKTLYLHQGVTYFRIEDDGDIFYKSTTGKILSDQQKAESEYFDSLLEYETYKILKFWINKFREKNPQIETRLIRQFPVILIPKSRCFPEYKHKVDFGIVINWKHPDSKTAWLPTVYLVESKGVITRDSMMILRLVESQYRGISGQRYFMVFSKFPVKYPRQFPAELIKSTPLNLLKTLDQFIKPIKED